MAVSRAMLARPAIQISSILSHPPSPVSAFAPISESCVHFGCRTRLGTGKNYESSRIWGNCGNAPGNSLENFERFSGKLKRDQARGFFSMAAATSDMSQTLPTEEDAEYKIQEQIFIHQKAAARLTHLEEARTLLNQNTIGTLSTISKKYDGFPFGSLVSYAADEDGSILVSISTLSLHTKDLELNPKCSLLLAKDLNDKSDTVITILGEALRVPEQEEGAVRAAYLKKHPGAFWVDFGDFRFMRIQPKKVRYVSGLVTGLAAVGDYTGAQFQATSVDPISQFAAPIAGHMNRDHSDQTAQIVGSSVGVKVDSALIQDVDRYGFGVLAKRQGKTLKLRIPFPRPAEDRKAVKTLIVEMLTGAVAPKEN